LFLPYSLPSFIFGVKDIYTKLITPSIILLQSLCKELGIETEAATNGKEALELLEKKFYSIYIVDLMMPVMDGKTFITELKKIHPDSVILVQTALDSPDTIIEIMKMGVFDYIVKPINADLFNQNILKALEYQYLKESEKNAIMNEGLKLRGQLEWLNYKETRLKTGEGSQDKNSIYNLKTSLSQGGGLGMMVSVIEMIQATATISDGAYHVDKEVMELLFENNNHSRQLLDGLDRITNLMEEKLEFTEIDSSELLEKLTPVVEDLKPYFQKKNLHVTLPISKTRHKLNINLEKILLVFEEVLINAYKYSTPKSQINIFCNSSQGYFCISVKNEVAKEPYGGVPESMEKLVIEPFFRIHPPLEDIISIEKFGLGLGLTVVDYLIRKHNGLFFIHDAIDHTGKQVSTCVLAEIFIPLKV
ncbi:MAG: response regulator, partial [Leptospiraceae bacterium]|nr:response regulator [Leptospiraceae bacterium]